MSRASSPSAAGRYGTARVCRVWEVPRSTVYARRARASRTAQPAAKRGPKQAWTDAALTEQIRAVLARSPFIGEGYRKAWARLRLAGVRTSKGRVLRLMRAAGLLAPTRVGRRRGPRNHDGTITTGHPDEMWGDRRDCLPHHPRGQRYRLHRRRPLHTGVRRHPRGAPRHALRGAGAAAPGAAGTLRRLRGGRRHGACAAPRPRQPVHERPLPGRAALPRHPLEPVVRGRARGQRLRRALHPHAQGAAALGRDVRDGRAAAPRAARVQRPLQPRLGSSSATATVPRPPFARRSRRAPERPHDYRLRGVQESGSGTHRFKSQRIEFCVPTGLSRAAVGSQWRD